MTDDFPIKGSRNATIETQNKEVKKAENGQQTNKKPKTTNGYNNLKDKLTIATRQQKHKLIKQFPVTTTTEIN